QRYWGNHVAADHARPSASEAPISLAATYTFSDKQGVIDRSPSGPASTNYQTKNTSDRSRGRPKKMLTSIGFFTIFLYIACDLIVCD
ncbi:MAG TPA: hypothetical protein VGZ01_07060, partial [Trinickia sp.]|nr:hypothetical protein [Trinickia sp.]